MSNHKICRLIVIMAIAGLSSIATAQQESGLPQNIYELSQLPEKERQRLKQKQIRFDQLDNVEKDKLREFYQRLQQDPNRERLNQVMQSYTRWLSALPSAQRRQILSLPQNERLVEIEKLIQEQETRRFKDLLNTRLDMRDLQIVSRWLNQWVQAQQDQITKYTDEIFSNLSEDVQQRIAAVSDRDSRMQMLLFASLESTGYDRWSEWFPEWDEATTELLESMSSNARATYDDAQTARERFQLIMRWGYYAYIASRMKMLNVDDRVLEQFYREELSETDRDFVNRLPAKEYRTALQRLYFRYKRPRGFPGIESPRPRPPRPDGFRTQEGPRREPNQPLQPPSP